MIFKGIKQIDAYLQSGGLVNPEMANHDVVRDMLIEIRQELVFADEEINHFETLLTKAGLCLLCGKPDWGKNDRHEYTKHGTNCPKD
jgi:hypothetical protein